jgi:hypothetical protein
MHTRYFLETAPIDRFGEFVVSVCAMSSLIACLLCCIAWDTRASCRTREIRAAVIHGTNRVDFERAFQNYVTLIHTVARHSQLFVEKCPGLFTVP